MLLTGCGLEEKTLAEFYEEDLKDVSKIVMTDGNTGYKETVTDKEAVNTFIDEIKDIKFLPEENQEARTGFNYSISFFDGNEETFQFGPTQVNENYYYTEPDIHPILTDFYKNMSEINGRIFYF
ncbi:hypothetical protein LCM20_17090 [Halobacillus litoralis]|uniref:hypothetical protein n=1 Tax=Halobacillus litoralis TaxID=45668 RepID=UPI001CD6323C|nr:hypothetical protein [Halobacillus litoralis]MCA0972326.1 hypothetical protein [Halobacillus litoralis]